MPNTAFDFSSLSPDLTLNALESIGIYPESGLQALNSYENRVYQFQDEARKRWVVKFYRPMRWTDEQILEEHDFSFRLQAAELPIAAPKKIAGESLFCYQDFRFALFPFMGGRNLELDNEVQIEQVAECLAKIHKVGQEKTFTQRPTMSINESLIASKQSLESFELIAKNQRQNFFTALDQLIEKISQVWQQDWQPIALHGDCHSGNILWQNAPIFVDLDDARNGPAIQDIWMLLNGDDKEKRYQLNLISEAYDQYANFPVNQIKLIEALRSMRMVQQTAWVANRWQDSAFPRAFPWFIEESYWLEQSIAFTQQIEAMEAPVLSLFSQW